jgi:hypothetical protein
MIIHWLLEAAGKFAVGSRRYKRHFYFDREVAGGEGEE